VSSAGICNGFESRVKLSFGDRLIIYFPSLPRRLLADATKDVARLVPGYQLIASGDKLSLSLKREWRNRLRTMLTVCA
jgi:hypothetical protein